ncbi:MAG TPA: hypothetical protein VIB00_06070 [Pyrinomonadaceae bacterium]|jgi:hypothetical protein
MRGKLLFASTALLLISFITVAAQKPDFSGEWTMDRARSFGMPGNMQQTMVVKQTGDQIELETKLIQPGNERSVKDNYVLDGKEHEFTPLGPPGAPPGKGKRTANWLPEGKGVVVNETTTSQTEKGPVTSQLTRKWTMLNGELIIDMYIDGPNGSFETKRIFIKK